MVFFDQFEKEMNMFKVNLQKIMIEMGRSIDQAQSDLSNYPHAFKKTEIEECKAKIAKAKQLQTTLNKYLTDTPKSPKYPKSVPTMPTPFKKQEKPQVQQQFSDPHNQAAVQAMQRLGQIQKVKGIVTEHLHIYTLLQQYLRKNVFKQNFDDKSKEAYKSLLNHVSNINNNYNAREGPYTVEDAHAIVKKMTDYYAYITYLENQKSDNQKRDTKNGCSSLKKKECVDNNDCKWVVGKKCMSQ